MKSTYINDNMLSAYPFAADEVLPISRSCISSLGVCLYVHMYDDTRGDISSVHISNMTITNDGASLSLRTDTGVALGVLKIGRTGGTAVVRADGIDGHMYGATGIIDDRSVGTYSGQWKLDSDCVNIVKIAPEAYAKTIHGVGANSARMDTQHTLYLNILGDVNVTLSDVSPESAGDIQVYANIDGDPKAGAVYIKPSKRQATKFVSAINTVKAPVVHGTNITLDTSTVLEFVSNSEYITLSLMGAANGEGAIISVNGHGKFPSCYGDEDESSIKDEIIWV